VKTACPTVLARRCTTATPLRPVLLGTSTGHFLAVGWIEEPNCSQDATSSLQSDAVNLQIINTPDTPAEFSVLRAENLLEKSLVTS
jgi:hypothetical protein